MATLGPQSAELANVAASATSVELFGAEGRVNGRTVWNDSANTLYIKFGATASLTDCTVKVDPDAYYEFPGPVVYSGVVHGIWDVAAGAARVTEW